MRKKAQTPNNQEFNNIIEFLTIKKALTIRAIAQKINIKENRVSQIKAGSNAVHEWELANIKKHYEIELEDFEVVTDPDDLETLKAENAALRKQNLEAHQAVIDMFNKYVIIQEKLTKCLEEK